MNQLGTVYATKRRRRNGKSLKPPPKDGVTKSNPSKRHRERLNAELDTLASLLPFEQSILSKLDRLSILRLSVSYLRTKSYFQVSIQKDQEERLHHEAQYRNRDLAAYEHSLMDGEMFLQALNGFLLILTCEGEVFFATHSIESYLGFHQSDIVHQSVYELVHSEDREELQRQLMWNSFLTPESANVSLQEVLQPTHCHLLERSFTVRFRCLLDNTSGFLRLDIRGRIKILHGQNRKTEDPPLALFALCTPFGPPSLLEVPQKEVMFKSKHKLDFSLVSMDQRGKMLLGYSDGELSNMGGYDLVHYDDLAYVASAHQELLKTGASGMIAYRLQAKESQWQWLQTSSRLVYKNSKPDFIISTHRPLMEEEGRDLLGKRTMDFKVSYLDAGLTNTYFTDNEPAAPTTQRTNRRYKTQLRDFLSTCRTKRKLGTEYAHDPATSYAAAANFNNVYASAAAYPTDNGLYSMPQNFQNLYPTIDNRFLSTDNLFQTYRPLGSYYSDYAHHATSPYMGNGFLDVAPRPCLPTYDTNPLSKTTDNKLYACQLDPSSPSKYSGTNKLSCESYSTDGMRSSGLLLEAPKSCDKIKLEHNGMEVKVEDLKEHLHYTNDTRQTVLMWGSGSSSGVGVSSRPSSTSASPLQELTSTLHYTSPVEVKKYSDDPLKSLADMNSLSGTCKWELHHASTVPLTKPTSTSPHATSPQATPKPSAAYAHYCENGSEVWHHQYYPYPPYHHTPHSTSDTYYPPISRNGVLCCPSLK